MNKVQFDEKYDIELFDRLIACRPKEHVLLSRLQLKMLKQTGMEELLPCNVVWWNEYEKMIYLTNAGVCVNRQIIDYSKDNCIQMLRRLLDILSYIEKSGYLFVENTVIDREYLFYDPKLQKLEMLYLPEEKKEKQSVGEASTELADALCRLMENTKLSEVFEWKQCEAYFRRTSVTAESMCRYFREQFPESGSAKKIYGRRRISTVLLRCKENGIELRMPVGSGECMVGRGNIYALNQFAVISSKHCKLFAEDDQAYVMDLGSTNGTFLNSKRLLSSKAYALKENVELSLAGLKFKVFFEWEN